MFRDEIASKKGAHLRRMYRLTPLFIFLGVLSFYARLEASNSLGFDVLGGVGTSGYGINGSVDLRPATVKSPYEVSVSYSHQHSTIGTESKTNQITGSLAHAFGDHWQASAQVTGFKDTVNDIHYVGPSLGWTYLWTNGSDSAPTDTELPSSQNEMSSEPAEKNEIAAVSINADLFFYGTEVNASSTTRRVFNRRLNRFVQQTVPPSSSEEKITQFHPSITAEKPLFDSNATPYLTYGHYFYSRDPADIEALAGRPRFASSANQLNGLVGGFLNNNAEVGLRASLPWRVESDFRIGAEQEITDNKWATTQGITLSRPVISHMNAKIDWSRVIQSGISSDLFTGGLTYNF